ncbi:MAG: FGGY-family carbohydrate kinase [Anaerolineae bacterium]|nr:FGGY-family carbohydrate kinase [Anaerolineae bacterium]
MLESIGISANILPPIVFPGDKIGTCNGLDVIVPSCHDTGSAVVGVPTTTKNYAYLSSGTWSLLGLEIDAPVINDASYAANVTNEGGVYGTFRLLKNIAGMWLVQQSRETWLKAGTDYSYAELVALAEKAQPFQSFIDPDAPDFHGLGDMPTWICAYCERTNQAVPNSVGQITRTIYESLAFKYRYVVDLLKDISGQTIETLHIIGGGSQNQLLCQMTADALGIQVIAGPTEATALGNAVVQFIAQGELANLAEARQMLSQTIETTTYEPKNHAQWEENYQRFKATVMM